MYCRSPDSEDYSPLDIEQITVAVNDSATLAGPTPIALSKSSNEKVGNESFFLLARIIAVIWCDKKWSRNERFLIDFRSGSYFVGLFSSAPSTSAASIIRLEQKLD